MPGPRVEYDRALKNFAAYAKRMSRGALKEITSQAAYGMCLEIARLVKAKYRSYPPQRYSSWMERAVRVGKEDGEFAPPRLPVPSSQRGMELYARAVQVSRAAGEQGYLIQVDPKRMHPDHRPLVLHAHWIENPKTMVIPFTLRAMVYRKMMKQGKGGYGTRQLDRHVAQGEKILGPDIVYTPKPRPVWRAVADDLVRIIASGRFAEDLKVRIVRMAMAYGAKPI